MSRNIASAATIKRETKELEAALPHQKLIKDQIDILNRELVKIWSSYSIEGNKSPSIQQAIEYYNKVKRKEETPFKHYAPILYPSVYFPSPSGVATDRDRGVLLFVGCNPSTACDDSELHPISVWNSLHEADLDSHVAKLIAKQKEAYDGYKEYFGAIHDFRTPLIKIHIDMFALWHTSQSAVKDLLKWSLAGVSQNSDDAEVASRGVVRKFFKDQFKATNTFINNTRPSQVVLLNAFTRDVFLANDKANRKNSITGFHSEYYFTNPSKYETDPARVFNDCLADTYIHAAAMLTGQRAMDVGSRERLEFVSKLVLNRSTSTDLI